MIDNINPYSKEFKEMYGKSSKRRAIQQEMQDVATKDFFTDTNLIPKEELVALRRSTYARVLITGMLGVFTNYMRVLYAKRGVNTNGLEIVLFILMMVAIYCTINYWVYVRYRLLCIKYFVPKQSGSGHFSIRALICGIVLAVYFLLISISWFALIFYPVNLVRGVILRDPDYNALAVEAKIVSSKVDDNTVFRIGDKVFTDYKVSYEYKGSNYFSTISSVSEFDVGEIMPSVYIKPINPGKAYCMEDATIFGLKDNGKMVNPATVVWAVVWVLMSGISRLYFPKIKERYS